MIATLSGIVEARFDPYIILNVHDVGYKVYISHPILAHHATIGAKLKLFIYTHIKEDLLDLYGFETIQNLQLFEALISVSGIGPKTAIGVFSQGIYPEIVQAIRDGDVAFFTSVPRLGRKNAQKVIIELRSKVGSKELLDMSEVDNTDGSELLLALKNFGFTANEAQKAIHEVNGSELSIEEKIKQALKYLGK